MLVARGGNAVKGEGAAMARGVIFLVWLCLFGDLAAGASGAFAADGAPKQSASAKTAKKAASAPVVKGGAPVQPNPAAMFPDVALPRATPEESSKLRESAAAYGKKDYGTAIAVLTPMAETGSARAAFSLGLMAIRGHGMPMSTEVAERWWIRSAKGGFPDAQYHLGFMYHQGLRGGRNPELVARLWSLAAARGQGDAMYGMGFMYRAGDGVPKDAKKSLRMFTDAADLGHPGAACEAGLMYKYGRGGASRDAGKARAYLKRAADAGLPQARRELAEM
jgi:TPR repeat protein